MCSDVHADGVLERVVDDARVLELADEPGEAVVVPAGPVDRVPEQVVLEHDVAVGLLAPPVAATERDVHRRAVAERRVADRDAGRVSHDALVVDARGRAARRRGSRRCRSRGWSGSVLDEPPSMAPFSSTTLPTRLFLSVTLLAPPCSNTAPVVLVPPASRSSAVERDVVGVADLSCRILLPGTPRNVTVLRAGRHRLVAVVAGPDLDDVTGRRDVVRTLHRLARGRRGARVRVGAARRDEHVRRATRGRRRRRRRRRGRASGSASGSAWESGSASACCMPSSTRT